jgi:AmmeMemoRadiSam system protein B
MTDAAVIRRPAVAGSFYPSDPAVLDALVDACVADAPLPASVAAGIPGLAGILVPHAGLVFSGANAGVGWRALAAAGCSTVVIVGTCHVAPWLEGIAVSPTSTWHLPGGDMAVDAALRDEIVALGGPFVADAAAHRDEHSVEVQLPFMRRLLPGARFVALTAGCEPSVAVEGGFALGHVLARHRAAGEWVAIAISTDFAHYPPRPIAEAVTTDHLPGLIALDPTAIHAVERGLRLHGPVGVDCGLCGLEATLVGISALKAMGATTGTLLARSTSADRPGSSVSRTVGYASLCFA